MTFVATTAFHTTNYNNTRVWRAFSYFISHSSVDFTICFLLGGFFLKKKFISIFSSFLINLICMKKRKFLFFVLFFRTFKTTVFDLFNQISFTYRHTQHIHPYLHAQIHLFHRRKKHFLRLIYFCVDLENE